ncbi:hypothetical protein AB0I02_19260 [Streptomyces phaeochromogenes]
MQGVQKGSKRDARGRPANCGFDSTQGGVVLVEQRGELVPMPTHVRQ